MIDLHTHTSCSDGILSVRELVGNAVKNNVEIISITDHDTIAGLSEYQNKYFRRDILVVPGVELSTETHYLGRKTKIHLLAYGYKVDDNKINKVLNQLYNRRCNDNMKYIEDLIRKFPFLSIEYFKDFDYGKYGWLSKKILRYINVYLNNEQLQLLKMYLTNNRPYYNRYNESIEDMLELIHSCNGYAVFAHPQKCDVNKEELQNLVEYLVNFGLDGLETYHIESNQNDRNYIHSLALKYDLYETGGSDFHSFKYANGVGDQNIRFPHNYEPLLVKKLIKENKVLGEVSE